MTRTFTDNLFLLAIFLLPWQTQLIFFRGNISGEPSAYAVLGVYAVEAMVLLVFLLRARFAPLVPNRHAKRALYLFLAAVFFSLSLSAYGSVGWFQVIHVVAAAMLFSLLCDKRTPLRSVLLAFLLGLTVPIVLAWLQVLTGASPEITLLGLAAKDAQTLGVSVVETDVGRMLRGYGTFPHPNIFGGYLAAGVLALAWLMRFVKSRRTLALALLCVALLSSTLIVTFSRSAWLSLALSLILLAALMRKEKKTLPRQAVPVIGMGLVCLLSILTIFHTQVFTRFDPTARLEAVSIEERTSQYQTFGRVFLSSSLLGVGPNAYTFTLSQMDPGQPVWAYQPIHNVFLLILAELGIIGFAVFFFWLGRIARLALLSRRTPNGMFALALCTTLLVVALLDHYLWTLWPGLALSALVLGLVVRFSKAS
ncbi:O-antigen ligase family protein [Candidatus Uhrbacteria bacterium]|nr:O-antigen ligase family protein [Candidatus Uhrbacteria bacterium]